MLERSPYILSHLYPKPLGRFKQLLLFANQVWQADDSYCSELSLTLRVYTFCFCSNSSASFAPIKSSVWLPWGPSIAFTLLLFTRTTLPQTHKTFWRVHTTSRLEGTEMIPLAYDGVGGISLITACKHVFDRCTNVCELYGDVHCFFGGRAGGIWLQIMLRSTVWVSEKAVFRLVNESKAYSSRQFSL